MGDAKIYMSNDDKIIDGTPQVIQGNVVQSTVVQDNIIQGTVQGHVKGQGNVVLGTIQPSSNISTIDGSKMKDVYPAEPGMSPAATNYQEDPDEYLKRILFQDEIVLDQFDCYFPLKMIPIHQLIFLCVITFGFYGFVLAFRALQRFMYRKRCCTPANYESRRGKLAITNKGRVITWKQVIIQNKTSNACSGLCCIFTQCFKKSCAAPTKFDIISYSKIFNAVHVRQVSQFYKQQTLFGCCCVNYESGVEISLGNFCHNSQVLDSPCFLTTEHHTSFGRFISSFNTWSFVDEFVRSFEYLIGATSNTNIMHIVSNTQDKVYNGDINNVYEDINNLYTRVISSLPPIPDCFVKNDDISTCKTRDTCGDELTGVTIVDTDGSIEIPWRMIPLLNGENIINSVGICYKLSLFEVIKSILTLGYFYCKNVSPKRSIRSALVLTTKRIIVIDIKQRSGMVPKNLKGLTNFQIVTRCYIPGKVTGGYINSPNFKILETAISTSAGLIKINFPTLIGFNTRPTYMPFVNAMQMSSNRFYVDAEDVKKGKGKGLDLNAFERAIATPLDASDLKFIPLLSGESILDMIRSKPVFQPFCKYIRDNGDQYICCKENKCGKSFFSFLYFPVIPFILSCALRPFVSYSDIIVTKNTVFHYTRVKNNGLCGYFGPLVENAEPCWPCDGSTFLCQTNDNIFVAWKPVFSMQGQTVFFHYAGDENFCSRFWEKWFCGKHCCPLTESTFAIDLQFDDSSFQVKGMTPNKNYKDEEEMKHYQNLINSVQVASSETMIRDGNFADIV
jgi:hypothetical protein